jgi:hypothetical protein
MVFTQNVLEQIESHIQPLFNYNTEISQIDVEEMLEDSEA